MNPVNITLMTQVRRHLHQYPEVSGQEVETKAYLMAFLKEHTQLRIVDCGRWFYAVYQAAAGKRNLAFRADIDALPMAEGVTLPHGSKRPGVAHKCGHDGHAAALIGLALEVEQHGAEHNLFFLFQHAEETGEGASECAAFIQKEAIDEIYAYHNRSGMALNAVHIINGTCFCASKGMIIELTGTPAHASEPEKGANPAWAVAELIQAIPALLAPAQYQGMVLCTVIQVDIGERTFGMSASKGRLLLTIRAVYEAEMDALQQKMEGLARQLAAQQGLTVSFSYEEAFPETANHPVCADRIRAVCRAKGLALVEMDEPFRASEDFGHYLKLIPGAICFIGNGENYPPLHTHAYDFPDAILPTAVELFKGLAGVTAPLAVGES